MAKCQFVATIFPVTRKQCVCLAEISIPVAGASSLPASWSFTPHVPSFLVWLVVSIYGYYMVIIWIIMDNLWIMIWLVVDNHFQYFCMATMATHVVRKWHSIFGMSNEFPLQPNFRCFQVNWVLQFCKMVKTALLHSWPWDEITPATSWLYLY